MRRLALLLILGCAACDSEPEAPTPLPVSGTWSLSHLVQAGGTTCGEGGSVTIAQSGASLTGTFSSRGACETPSVAVDFLRSGDLLSGAVADVRIRFTLGVCRYEGTLVGNPPTQAGGTATCNGLPGTTGDLIGNWELTR